MYTYTCLKQEHLVYINGITMLFMHTVVIINYNYEVIINNILKQV